MFDVAWSLWAYSFLVCYLGGDGVVTGGLLYTAASRAVVRAWLRTDAIDRTSAVDLRSWILTSCSTDKQFENVAYFFLRGIPPSLILLRKGLRRNNWAAWLGGGSLLVPLLWVRGHTNLAGLSLQDSGTVSYRAPLPVRQQAFLSVNKVALDEPVKNDY